MPTAFDFIKGPRGANGLHALIDCLLIAVTEADRKDKPMQIINSATAGGDIPTFVCTPVSMRMGHPVLPDEAAIICYPDGSIVIHDSKEAEKNPQPKRLTRAEKAKITEELRAKALELREESQAEKPVRKKAVRKPQIAQDETGPKPSEEMNKPWLVAMRKTGEYPQPTENSGKWLVFVPLAEVDAMWAQIKSATEEGKLGGASKVATAMPNRYRSDEKVICVYTCDWTNEEDVKRIRGELRKLGIERKIAYKADSDTRSGKYRASGDSNISKYYE
ncbi:DUF1917 domain-containing protein [bacterium]|nr:MAG: DUF1917 domain-containing protein [bacterium]